MEYKIVAGVAHNHLEDDVNKLIKEGWVPLGGISTNGTGNKMYQCMVRTPTNLTLPNGVEMGDSDISV